MELSILDTGLNTCSENMKIDELLLKELNPKERPTLHLYRWKGACATYGHFAKPQDLLDMDGVEKRSLHLAKRVTGGGMTFHFSDFAFSFFMPKDHPHFSENTLENYQFVNQFVLMSVKDLIKSSENLSYFEPSSKKEDPSFNFCMAKPTKYDVLYKGKKIGGAAQRRTVRGYLHHGTISIGLPDPTYLKDILRSKESVFRAINQNTFYFVSNHLKTDEMEEFRVRIQKKLIDSMLQF